MPLEPGAQFGEFKLIRPIGRGSMGEVFLAEQPSLRRSVALKILHPSLTADPAVLERFRREALNSAKLRHGAIVPVFGAGEQGALLYIAMDYIEGRSLDRVMHEMLERKVTPGPELIASFLRIAIEIAEALHFAHEEGVLHRDVKPSNILLDRRGRPYLSDFGLARHRFDSPLTMSGDLVGTPRYMAPELLDRRIGPVDRRSDVYSLGATLYELLTLRPPFDGEGLQELFARIREGVPARAEEGNPAVLRSLGDALERSLVRDPAGRFRTAREFADALRGVLQQGFSGYSSDSSLAALLGSMRAEEVETPRPPTPVGGEPSTPSQHEASHWLSRVSANPKWLLAGCLVLGWMWLGTVYSRHQRFDRDLAFGAYPFAFFVLVTVNPRMFRGSRKFWMWVFRGAAFLLSANAFGGIKGPIHEWVYTGFFIGAHLLFDRWFHRGELPLLAAMAVPLICLGVLSGSTSTQGVLAGIANVVGPLAIYSLSSSLVVLPAFFLSNVTRPSPAILKRAFLVGIPAAVCYFLLKIFVK